MLFDVVIPDRDDWNVGSCLGEDQVFYTDGCEKSRSTGEGILGPGARVWSPAPATVFKAEICLDLV